MNVTLTAAPACPKCGKKNSALHFSRAKFSPADETYGMLAVYHCQCGAAFIRALKGELEPLTLLDGTLTVTLVIPPAATRGNHHRGDNCAQNDNGRSRKEDEGKGKHARSLADGQAESNG